jgi:hypothetical protein
MNNHPANLQPQQTPGDARDILARLYREIGISAVAAALQVSQSPSAAPKADDAVRWTQRRFNDHAA